MQALYQSLQVNRISGTFSLPKSVVEIGGGTGRTAALLLTLGFDVAVCDLPLGLISQAIFISQTLGEECLDLEGTGGIKKSTITFMDPHLFLSNQQRTGLVLNVDSFTEMSDDMVNQYLEVIRNTSQMLLSINHEVNDFTVSDKAKVFNAKQIYRNMYWMRPGYVEELYSFESRFSS